LNVKAVTVGRWLGGDMQCSNSNALDLIDLAIELVPDKVQTILFEDSARYQVEIERTLFDHGDEG